VFRSPGRVMAAAVLTVLFLAGIITGMVAAAWWQRR
jgi:hypothetical protein